MQLESWVSPCILFGWWFSPCELWRILVNSYCCFFYVAANTFSSLGPFFSSFIGDLVLSSMDGCEHPLLYLWGSGRASPETAISGSCQQNLVGIHYSVWVWWLYMGWIPRWGSVWMVILSVSAPNFVSETPSMGILFPLLRRILRFWANFYLLVSVYHLCSSVNGLPHTQYPPDPFICLRIS